MTREQASKLWPVIKAWGEGKDVETRTKNSGPWEVYIYSSAGFDNSNWEWRIKLEPKLRPWKPEEVPVGAQLRYKIWPPGSRVLITEVINDCIYTPNLYNARYRVTLQELFEGQWEHSLDHGKTWHPCGVEETEQ